MSARSRLVSKPKNRLISNSGQLFKAADLSPITFGITLPLILRGKISTNSQNNLGIRIGILKYVILKYYYIAELVHQSYIKMYYRNVT